MTVIITFYDLYHKSHQTVISGKREEKIIGYANREPVQYTSGGSCF
jgi:hypothetical protein